MHPGGALRRRGRKNQAPDDGRPDQRDLLRDEAADGEPEDVGLAEAHGGDEIDRVVRHLPDRVRGVSGRTAYPGIVKGDDPPVRGQGVDQRRIPAVEVAAEMLEQDERYLALARIAVGVVDAAGRADKHVREF